jgi:transcriptional regulator GlxA family with amidase domain
VHTNLKYIQDWPERARQAQWSVTVLAQQCGVSADTLRRHFLKQMGKSPGTWLTEQRQKRAVELLRDGSSIKETSAYLGYKHQTNFTRKYKEYWGACPSLPRPFPYVPGQSA